MDDLKEVIGEIRKLEVITTETFIAYEKAPQKTRLRNSHIRRLGDTRVRD